MKILILGGTGFISGRLVGRLVELEHDVTVFTRGVSPIPANFPSVAAVVRGDRADPESLRAVVNGRTFDVVFDMVAYTASDSDTAVQVFRGHLGRFIHCSTISVYMVSNDVQCPITEDQDKGPLMPHWPRNPFGMDYGIGKRGCEEVLWSEHDEVDFPVTMLRPTYVSGPGDPIRRDHFWIQRILDGGPLLVPGIGDFAFQQVFLDDVVQAFLLLLDHPDSVGKAYNVAAEEIFSLNDYLHALGALLGREPEMIHIEQQAFDALPISSSPEGDVFPFNTRRESVFSLDRIKHDLGYRSTPWDEWMNQTIDWYLTTGRDSIGYRNRDREIEIAARWRRHSQKGATGWRLEGG